MPLYEYKCYNCSHNFDLFHQSIAIITQKEKDKEITCPECNSNNVLRKISKSIRIDMRGMIRMKEADRRKTVWSKDGRNLK